MIKKFRWYPLTVLLFIFTACTIARSDYAVINKINVTPTDLKKVEYFVIKPKRAAICIGIIHVNGTEFADSNKVIKEAVTKAASMGGDFIVKEESGNEKKTVYSPGYSTYNSNGSGYLFGSSSSIVGSAKQMASGYSVGASTYIYDCPWGIYTVWVYRPSYHGFECDEDNVVKTFHLNSDAPSVGLRIGDKVIGIDNIDINEEKLAQHLMEINPSDKMVVSILREGQRMDFTITALPN